MKFLFYPKLALDGIRKNKRMYLPYFFTCAGMVMMYYIVTFLLYDELLSAMRGEEVIFSILSLGGWVIAVFSCLFLFYTNSFLLRRRKKEFGLYSILGMGKRNIARILFWETLLIAFVSLAVGLGMGIAVSKLAELGLVNLLHGKASFSFAVSFKAVAMTAEVFGVIFLLLLLNGLRQVRFSSPLALLRSETAGEKPPKANYLLGILGVLLLAAAYYIAVTIKEPVAALTLFFVAVLMVIAGSYLCFIAGSVLLCRILQKRKGYYYKPNHFVSVSSMVYRMKRNGAGLASICILATMVLVMISSTVSLYFGAEDALRCRYPRDLNLSFRMTDAEALRDEAIDTLKRDIDTQLAKAHTSPENLYFFRSAAIAGLLEGNTVETDASTLNSFSVSSLQNVTNFYFIPLADYNAMTGENETLSTGEALLYRNRSGDFGESVLHFNNGCDLRIKKQLPTFFTTGESSMEMLSSIFLVVPDLEESLGTLPTLADYNGDRMVAYRWVYNFDTSKTDEENMALNRELRDFLYGSEPFAAYGLDYVSCESLAEEKEGFYSLYGGLFYLGILLSIVFLFAAVLIIYYKQISEGYEDQRRFEIMQRVGMTKKEIRRSINSQLLTVFFLPLLFAGMHLAFAFPMIRRLLMLFNLTNVLLFAGVTVGCFLLFALFYALVYRITSGAYYGIVSGISHEGDARA